MLLCDVNVLLHAFHEQSPNHDELRAWLQRVLASDEAFAVSELVLSSVLRISTHPKIFKKPASLAKALRFCGAVRGSANATPIAPGPKHWSIFERLCVSSGATGNLVPDAYLAALAIEHSCEWISLDHDYERFTELRWRRPLST